jgi:hypothetical protein
MTVPPPSSIKRGLLTQELFGQVDLIASTAAVVSELFRTEEADAARLARRH